jgi:hypothetical protein
MAERVGHYVLYSADDEMPNCMSCDHIDNFDCVKFCGAEHGWYGYARIVDTRVKEEQQNHS